MTPEEHKRRWFRKFILAADGKRFFYSYDESKKKRILGDLRDNIITLTEEDIQSIPNARSRIDIFLLLIDHDFIKVTSHPRLYLRCLEYLADFWFLTNDALILPLSPVGEKIRDILILKTAPHLLHFFQTLPALFQLPAFADFPPRRILSIQSFFATVLESSAARELCWNPSLKRLTGVYEEILGEGHFLPAFFREVYSAQWERLYRSEKAFQKAKMDGCKEEMMMVCWHPKRFFRLLELGKAMYGEWFDVEDL